MTLASDFWNALSFEDRERLLGVSLENQARDIRIEMARAKRAHAKHMDEARAHLKNIERELERWNKKFSGSD